MPDLTAASTWRRSTASWRLSARRCATWTSTQPRTPRALGAFGSFPDDLLSHMREVQGRLKRTKGNLAHSAGLDITFIQSDWNTMVTTSDLPLAIQGR